MLPKILSLTEKKHDAESLDNDKSELVISNGEYRRRGYLFAGIAIFLLLVSAIVFTGYYLNPRTVDFRLTNLTQAAGIAVGVQMGSDNSTSYNFNLELAIEIDNQNYYDVQWDSIVFNVSFPTPNTLVPPTLGSAILPPDIRLPARQTTYLTLPFTVSYNFTTSDSDDARAYMELLYACGLYGSELEHPLEIDWSLAVHTRWLAHSGQDSWTGQLDTLCPVSKQILTKLPVPADVAVPLPQGQGNNSYGNFVGK